MTLRVSGKNLDIGESLRKHVLEKVEGMVARYFNGTVGGHIVISREGSGYRSDCTLQLSSGVSLHAEGRAHEPYPCFEQAADKIEARLRRYKQRLKGHTVGIAPGKVADLYGGASAQRGGRAGRRLQSGGRGGRNRSVEVPFSRFGGGRTRFDRRAGRRVRARGQRTGERCLSAPDGAIGWVDPH